MVPSKSCRAIPKVWLAEGAAFMATPGMEDTESRSPLLMGPFSFETLSGTRPERASGTFFSPAKLTSSKPPRRTPGLVETIPSITEVEVARTTNSGLLKSMPTISPAARVASLVGYFSAMPSPSRFIEVA